MDIDWSKKSVVEICSIGDFFDSTAGAGGMRVLSFSLHFSNVLGLRIDVEVPP
jgi:hypothetical protein